MQSTGHSSTQPLSLTSMHGSAITYVIRGATSSSDLPGLVCWLGGLLAAAARHLHFRRHLPDAAGLAGALLGVAAGPPGPDGADLLAQRLVGRARAQRAAQVVPGGGEQAGVQLA